MATFDELIRDLRKFDQAKTVKNKLRKRIRQPVPAIRRRVRQRALDTLPARGGLNKWVAKASVTAAIKFVGNGAGVKLKGSRKSGKGKADLRRLDAGAVRHPSWGRRGADQWHTQTVPAGYFTVPVSDDTTWRPVVLYAVDEALRELRG